MSRRHTFVNAVLGAVAGIVLSFLPFSPLLGGALSGFLEGPDGRDGTVAGTLAGLLMYLPFGLLGVFVLGVLGFGFGLGGLPIEGFAVFAFFFAFAATVLFVYTVGLAAVGGLLGAYLAQEYPDTQANARETIGMGNSRASRRNDHELDEFEHDGSTIDDSTRDDLESH